MSSRFYDERGFMVGLDKHLFMHTGIPYIGVPEPNTNHIVGQSNWLLNNKQVTSTVTSDSWHMCQTDFSLGCIPHVPLEMLNNWAPAELVVLAALIYFSESKPRLKVQSVKGDGKALCATLVSIVGVNKNCEGHGIAFQWNSVQTQPSVGDYASMAAAFACELAVDKALEHFSEDEPHWTVRWARKKGLDQNLDPIVEWLSEQVQKHVDEAL